VEARCAQCGTLWQIDAKAIDSTQPYQCNACGFIFTIALEGASPMQIRHTNGKIYKVKDLTTLVRWVGEKRVPRQCMIREDEGEWRQALAVPEVAEAFAMLDARRQQISNSPAAVAPEAVAAVVDAAAQPADPTSITGAVLDVADLPSGPSADDEAALEAALEMDFSEPIEDAPADAVEVASDDEATEMISELSAAAASPVDDGEDHSFDDAFDLLEEMTHEPSDVPGLSTEEDPSETPKKSKMPLIAAAVVVVAAVGYFATSGGGSDAVSDPMAGDDPAAKALRATYERGLEALASGEPARMTEALAGLEPAMCLKGCDQSQCLKDEKGGCAINPDAGAFAPFFLLYDRLWLEANMTNPNLQSHAGAVLKALQAQAESPYGKERLGVVADSWNAIQPTVDETSNKSAAGLQDVSNAAPQAVDTPVYLALKMLDGDEVGKAAPLLAGATQDPAKKPDARITVLTQARMARGEAAAKGCGPVNEAYLAAVKAGLPNASRELAMFLATNGDLKGAALAVGKTAGEDPILKAIVAAAAMGPQATDAELKAKFGAAIKATFSNRKKKKDFATSQKMLKKNSEPTALRGDLLDWTQELIPSALAELMEAAWIEVTLGQAAAGEAKAGHGAKALKRFERVLAADPNRRDAWLGRAAAAALSGKADAHRADAFAWFMLQPGSDKPACSAQPEAAKPAEKPAEKPPAK
jgi:hypothetical protein